MSRHPRPSRLPTALLDRIEAARDGLRPSEQAVARFVLKHPNRVIDLTLPEVAAQAGVSQPTVARFCAAIGVDGFRAFKLKLAQSLAQGVPFVHRDVTAGDALADIGAKVLDRAIAALVSLRNHLDAAALERATALLSKARRIEFYGSGNSGIVAMDAQHKFFRLGPPAVAYADPHIQAMAASLLGRGDVVVAISGSGSSQDLVRSVEIARAAGAEVIAIAPAHTPLARAASLLVPVDVTEDLDAYAPMTSRLMHLAIVDVLAVSVAVAGGPPLSARLRRAKAAVAERHRASPTPAPDAS